MKWAVRLSVIPAVMLVTMLTASPGLAQFKPEFCWKDSYGRGAGTIPTACAPGQDMRGLFCYSVCPAGMRDDGLYCRRAEYGRGAGYAWEFRDGFSNAGMISRCERDNGSGNCEMSGAIAYAKCRKDYAAAGCCICRPSVPNCTQLGLLPGIDLSCAKRGPYLGICPAGNSNVPGSAQQMDAGLCYRGCDAGYQGVGPVCWKKPPPGWVDCGMGAAKDQLNCAKITFDQVTAVGRLALNVASLGSSMIGGVPDAGKLAQLKGWYDQLQAAYTAAKTTHPALQTAETALNYAAKASSYGYALGTGINTAAAGVARTPEDWTRLAAQMAAVIDATGVSATIGSFTYPKCSKYEELLGQ
jgi:hypothetical protein